LVLERPHAEHRDVIAMTHMRHRLPTTLIGAGSIVSISASAG
jgi:hypothetical protein